jgi:predicted nucleotidyltransferase component of viral defense system
MNKTDLKKYISYVKGQKHSLIDDYYVEKDYFLSLFLSTWQELKGEKKLPHMNALIFKGGTLLIRNYLQYPRISEDLDFTHEDSQNFRDIENKNKRENEIKKRVVPIIDEIKLICDTAGFDFKTDRTNPRHIIVRNSRAVYVFYMYYISLSTGEEIPIKLEVNFLENIMNNCLESKINNFVEYDTFLKSIGYDIKNITMKTYSLDEIILEKYRAILTRDALKERDVLDLYLIHQRKQDVFKADNISILKKIESGVLISSDLNKNLEKNCTMLQVGTFFDSDDNISRFTLVEIDDYKYEKFKIYLMEKLKELCTLRNGSNM